MVVRESGSGDVRTAELTSPLVPGVDVPAVEFDDFLAPSHGSDEPNHGWHLDYERDRPDFFVLALLDDFDLTQK